MSLKKTAPFLLLGIVSIFAYTQQGAILRYIKPTQGTKSASTKVAGVSADNKNGDDKSGFSLPLANNLSSDVQKNIDSIKQEVSSLRIEEVASSSPQIQKVLNDIKELEKYPRDQAKEMCQKLCNGL